ncbi:MAG: VOC family protein [Dongiaceae bacterium]
MKIRTVYFKVPDMKKAVAFWRAVLQIEPHKTFDEWHEFWVGQTRLGLLLERNKEKAANNCVPVFEFASVEELRQYLKRAQENGAKMVFDGLEDPDINSIVLADLFGHEFEFTKIHD